MKPVLYWLDMSYLCTDIRLVGGAKPSQGRVEIYAIGEWGSICDDNWGHQEVAVVCRQLGFDGPGTAVSGAWFIGQDEQMTWMSDSICDGTETSFTSCLSSLSRSTTVCSENSNAGVYCGPLCKFCVTLRKN